MSIPPQNTYWQFTLLGLDPDSDIDEPYVISSPIRTSPAPASPLVHAAATTQWHKWPDLPEDPLSDTDFTPDPDTPIKQAPALSDTEKVKATMKYMRSLPQFSLCQFLEVLFMSDDGDIKNFTSIFLSSGGYCKVLDIWWNRVVGNKNSPLRSWAVEKAATICAQEASWLTNRASEGPHYRDAQSLRVSSKDVTVSTISNFCLANLTRIYNKTMPSLQVILKSTIGKDHADPSGSPSPTADAVSTH